MMEHTERGKIPVPTVALVTGGNKGIGLAIVRQLATKCPEAIVLLGSRDAERGQAAVDELHLSNVVLQVIDITNEESVSNATAELKDKYDGLHILVNNAGLAIKGNGFDAEIAQQTQETNYYGTLRALTHLVPIMKPGGRVVNVSSRASLLCKISNDDLRNRFIAEDLTIDELTQLMEKFVQDVKDDRYAAEGWPRNTYAVSKMGVSALTRIFAREESKNTERADVAIMACCPGCVKTDMAGPAAPRTPDQGAEVEVLLALLPPGAGATHSGKFFNSEGAEISYVDAPLYGLFYGLSLSEGLGTLYAAIKNIF
eukprot:TRINITY_DN6893_c0_g1_i1.p1 TRINITY_DN6893_c0_g1~~TRINITY_DN6893_c0_g1_i1.p1  ORF type:complete len:313 (+),score=42.55 TRINITY_DN6893_c0_g1_i1:17-955(+)